MPNPDVAALLEGLPQAALIIGRDNKVLVANDLAQAQIGAMEGRHYAISLRQPDLLGAIEASLAAGGAAKLRIDWRYDVGAASYDVSLAPLPGGLLCLFDDVSGQTQTDQMRRDFVANVSHELRTPLTALQGFIETLQGPARGDAAAQARFLGIMAQEADRMSRLVTDLLHLSRVEAQERLRPATPQDIAALVRRAVDGLRPLAANAKVALHITGADAPAILPADSDQITQVIVNLVENAVKYGSIAGGSVDISLGVQDLPRGPALCLAVQDHGAGIATEHIPRLTERFYRVDSHRSRAQGGTGLGLAIVKHIVARHRGKLVIDSREGQGSRFAVLLPFD